MGYFWIFKSSPKWCVHFACCRDWRNKQIFVQTGREIGAKQEGGIKEIKEEENHFIGMWHPPPPSERIAESRASQMIRIMAFVAYQINWAWHYVLNRVRDAMRLVLKALLDSPLFPYNTFIRLMEELTLIRALAIWGASLFNLGTNPDSPIRAGSRWCKQSCWPQLFWECQW